MKKCHSLLSAVFVFLLCYAGTVALRAETYGAFDYSWAGDGVAITRYNGNLAALDIPSSIDGCTVTRIGNFAFQSCHSLTSVTIPNSVTSIGIYAFQFDRELKSVIIPNSVTSIGYQAFTGCSGLRSVTIPNSMRTIGNSAFYGCVGLKSVTIPNSVTSIGDSAFKSCSGLNSVTIPNSVTSIWGGAFSDCIGLKSVTIPNSVTSIGYSAFYGCNGLTSVTIPNSVTSIGVGAFSGCSGLKSVTIPNSVTSIGDHAFESCSSLKSVTIPNSVTSIGYIAFAECTGLTSVTIPNSVTSIGVGAFSGCSGLKSVTIPSNVPSYGDWVFDGCIGLKSLIISPLQSRIGDQFQFDFSKYGIDDGAMKLVGGLPTGLTFNPETGMIEGQITGKAGKYPLSVQIVTGKTVIRSISLPLVIDPYTCGVAGTFHGLLEANSSGLPAGKISLVVTASGGWTASLELVGSSKALTAKGSFSNAPEEVVDLTIPFSSALTVDLHLDPNSALVSGAYPEGSIEGFRMASGSELPTANQSFTLTLDQGAQDGITIPAGMGWATGTVSNKGAIALTGQLGDGKAFKIATQLSATGQAIIWLKPYRDLNSFVGGIISLRDRGLVKDEIEYVSGGLRWYRVADVKEPSYPNGFDLWVDAGIAPYKVPVSAATLAQSLGLETTTFPRLIIDGGGLPDAIVASLPTSLTLDQAFKLNAVKNVGQTLLPWTASVNKANGSFSGTLTLPVTTSDVLAGPATVSGVLLGGSYYSPHVGSGLVKIPLKSPKGSFRTAAMVTSGETP